jgi:hypothetical protein
MFALPAAADEDAVNVKTAAAEPAVTCALCGETEMPEGTPEGCSVIVPENPLVPEALTLTVPEPDDASVSVETESAMLKSGVAVIPPPPPVFAEPPPPQPATAKENVRSKTQTALRHDMRVEANRSESITARKREADKGPSLCRVGQSID